MAVFRSLLIYLICVPLAIFLGYLLADPLDLVTFGTVVLVLFFLTIPLIMRYHHPLLVLSWNFSMVLFFLPGRPQIWMAVVALSLLVSIFQRTISKHSPFIQVPQLNWPLLALFFVILLTARATGGIGMRILGGASFGGKKYIVLLLGIMGYFALTAHRIPPRRAGLYLALFFLGGLSSTFADLFPVVIGSWVRYIYLLFPPVNVSAGMVELGVTRFIGLTAVSTAFFALMLARYGIRGIFLAGRPVRIILFLFVCFMGLFGGFRSLIIGFILTFTIQFFLEGLHRTKMLPVMVLGLCLTAGLAIPFTASLPATFQRALAFLPVPIDPAVRLDAQGSSEWRLAIWKRVLPQVPKYFWLGKGYEVQGSDLMLATDRSVQGGDNTEWAELAGDYHNGPLSIIIPFGIWGAGAFLWLLLAGGWVLRQNYRYGNPDLRNVNSYLLAAYITSGLMFLSVVGALESNLLVFVGYLGLSVSMNGGVARPAPQTITQLAPTIGFASVLPRPRSAFGR